MKSFFVPVAIELDQSSQFPIFIEKRPQVDFLDPDALPFIYHILFNQTFSDETTALTQLNSRFRPQYADWQDIGLVHTENTKQHVIFCLKQQMISHLLEQALNAQIMYSKFYLDENNHLVSPFSPTPTPFNLSRLIDVVRETRDYLLAKFQTEPSQEDINWLDQNLEHVIPILFSNQFLQTTRQGLELSELMGLRKLEQMLEDADDGDLILLFSPYSPHRATEIAYNVTMIGEVKMENGTKVLHMTYARNTLSFEQYRQQFLQQNANSLLIYPKSAIDLVSQPILIKGKTREELFANLDIYENQPLIDLYQQAIEITTNREVISEDVFLSEKKNFEKLIQGMLTGNITVPESVLMRQKLEKAVIHNYQQLVKKHIGSNFISHTDQNFIDQTIAGLGRGGLCGFTTNNMLSNEIMGVKDQYGALDFECPHCHNLNTRPFGKLIEHCQSCGRQIPKC